MFHQSLMPRLIRATDELSQRVATIPLDGTGLEERPQVPHPSSVGPCLRPQFFTHQTIKGMTFIGGMSAVVMSSHPTAANHAPALLFCPVPAAAPETSAFASKHKMFLDKSPTLRPRLQLVGDCAKAPLLINN